MRYRPINSEPKDPRLDRLIPDSWDHVQNYPLTAETTPNIPVPVTIGINWYSDFDNPVLKGGRWWIGLDSKNLGSIRGGHCVCLEPGDALADDGTITRHLQDANSWYEWYNQGAEGACVGFGSSRMMSLLNRKRYFARWLWDMAKSTDEWSDTNPGDDNGTSVHAAMQVLAQRGHIVWKATPMDNMTWQERDKLTASTLEGISAYRWATTADQVQSALKSPANARMGAVRVLNSWGTDYPHRVWMPNATLQRLLDEDGEATLVTDR